MSVYDKEQHFCCFECDEKITVPAGSIKGEIIQCSNCSQDFELLDNGVVVKAEKIGEDWGE